MLKLLVLILILFVLISLLFSRKKRAHAEPSSPATWYTRLPSLFTPAEQYFLASLETAIENIPVRIYGKTRIADLIRVRPKMSRSDYGAAFNKIRSKHVDFVLVDPYTFSPLLVIELDDSSHELHHRKLRDAFVDDALMNAGIPILHIPLRKRYDEKALKQEILNILKIYQES